MIKDILKGAVMGIANIIPGVSGGTMAVSMGIYDKIIHAVTHLFSEFKKSLKTLVPIGIGIVLAIVVVARLIEYMFRMIPFETNLLFIGLILGGLPAMAKKVKGSRLKPGHIIACLLFFALVVGCASLEGNVGSDADLSFGFLNVLKLFGVGIIASATMVVPGVSGSMILLLLGYYNPIIENINAFIRALTSFDVDGILKGFGVLVPFGIGVVVGIFAIAKLIEIIFAKFPLYAFWAIIGLIVASPIAIVLMNLGSFANVTILAVIAGVITLPLGFFIAMKLGE